jgi:hypothetical protein
MNTYIPATSPGGNRSHTQEDLCKMENRVNLTLFGAHGIREFWGPLCRLLGISHLSWLTREVISGRPGRPDFILNGVGPSSGCIEVELGGPNGGQNKRYREELGYEPVICIVGRRDGPHGHTSLEEVADLANAVAIKLQGTNLPAREVLRLLADTIHRSLNEFTSRASVQLIPARLLELPWFAAAFNPLSRLQQAGYLVNRTTSNHSLSLQLERLPCMGGKRLAILTQRDPVAFHLPAPTEMTRVLGEAFADVTAAWEDMLQRVLPNWPVYTDGNRRVRIEAKVFEQNIEAFTLLFTQLADCIVAIRG